MPAALACLRKGLTNTFRRHLTTPTAGFRAVTGRRATVRALNFDSAYKNVYVQKARVNGKPWTKSWIGHELFTEGWTLELTLGSTESDWGKKAADRPPSWTS